MKSMPEKIHQPAVILAVSFLIVIVAVVLFFQEGSALAEASAICKWMSSSSGIMLLVLIAALSVVAEMISFPITGWFAFGAVTIGAAIAHFIGSMVRNARIAEFQERVNSGELIEGIGIYEAERYRAYSGSDIIVLWWIIIVVCIILGIVLDILLKKEQSDIDGTVQKWVNPYRKSISCILLAFGFVVLGGMCICINRYNPGLSALCSFLGSTAPRPGILLIVVVGIIAVLATATILQYTGWIVYGAAVAGTVITAVIGKSDMSIEINGLDIMMWILIVIVGFVVGIITDLLRKKSEA